MKNKWILVLGVLLLVFSVVFISCDNGTNNGTGEGNGGDDTLKGTWVSTGTNAMRMEASNGSFKQYLSANNTEVVRGTYTVSGNAVAIKITHVNTVMFGAANTLVAWADLSDTYKGYIPETQQITISGNTFTANGQIFTKQ